MAAEGGWVAVARAVGWAVWVEGARVVPGAERTARTG